MKLLLETNSQHPTIRLVLNLLVGVGMGGWLRESTGGSTVMRVLFFIGQTRMTVVPSTSRYRFGHCPSCAFVLEFPK